MSFACKALKCHLTLALLQLEVASTRLQRRPRLPLLTRPRSLGGLRDTATRNAVWPPTLPASKSCQVLASSFAGEGRTGTCCGSPLRHERFHILANAKPLARPPPVALLELNLRLTYFVFIGQALTFCCPVNFPKPLELTFPVLRDHLQASQAFAPLGFHRQGPRFRPHPLNNRN